MQVYTKIVIDMKTGRVEETDSFEYDGPVAECKGGGSQKSTTVVEVDKEYNARMAKIAEEAQNMSAEMYNMFKYGVPYNPDERVQVGNTAGTSTQTLNPAWVEWNKAPLKKLVKPPPQYISSTTAGEPIYKTRGEINGYDPSKVVSEMQLMQKQLETEYGMLPLRTETERLGLGLEQAKIAAESGILGTRYETERMGLGLQQKNIAAEESLLPQKTTTTRLGLEAQASQAQDRMKTIRERAPVISKLYEDALSGVDVNRRVGEAQTAVQIGFAGAEEQAARGMSRYGINPNSGRGLAAFRNIGVSKAGALAGASTAAQNQAEAESFERRKVALGVPVL